MFYGYIKDCNDIANKPKAFVRVSVNGSSTIGYDLLTSKKTTFSVLNIPSNINNGDIFTVYDSKGEQWYAGKITSYSDNSITCSQKHSILSGEWLCENVEGYTYLEDELKAITEHLISGKVGNYTDEFIANKYKDFEVVSIPSTLANLPTFEDNKVMDFEAFIYQMYSDYGIVFDVDIQYEGKCTIKIFKPDYNTQLIANNTQVISSITPTLQIKQYNKLVVFSKGSDEQPSTYRATYVVSADSTPRIVKLDDESVLNRFVETNTKIVFSDDELDTIVSANLSVDMYNHKLTFEMLLDNKIYDFKSIKLGQPLEVWNGTDYYKTVITGYEITLPARAKPTSVKLICGKVRTALTDKIKMGV